MNNKQEVLKILDKYRDMSSRSLCTNCGGDGWTTEHDPSDRSEAHMRDGECTSCPVQMACDYCESNGYILGHPATPLTLLKALDNMLYMMDGMGNLYKMKMKLSDKLPKFDTSFEPIKIPLTTTLTEIPEEHEMWQAVLDVLI